jgi:hypothetical protein
MGLIDPAPIECHWIQVVTYAAMRADGHLDPPAFSTYIRDEAGSTCGVQVTSLPNLANMIRTLSPQRVELVCGEQEDSAQLRRDLEFLIRGGTLH